MQATSTREQVKLQSELFAKILSRPAVKPPEGTAKSGTNGGYVTELVGYHAIKRVSADITRGLSSVVGLGNDVRIMIVDGLDYATGDIPFIEVTSQLSVFEVRCRKQVAANKELADLTMQKDEQGDEEKTPAVKSGATRLAPLAASPFFLPAITTSPTALPAGTGIAGTPADIAGYFRSDYSFKGRNVSLKTEGLIAAVAGSLKSEKRNVYIYNFYSMDTTGPQSKLMNMYAGVLDCSSRLAQSQNRLLYFISKKTGVLAELKISLKKLGEADTHNRRGTGDRKPQRSDQTGERMAGPGKYGSPCLGCNPYGTGDISKEYYHNRHGAVRIKTCTGCLPGKSP